MGRGLFFLVVVMSVWASEVSAQDVRGTGVVDLGLDAREQLRLDSDAAIPTGVYVSANIGLLLATTAALVGVFASPVGDYYSIGVLNLAAIGAPVLGSAAAILLSIAAGYDGVHSAWQRQHDRRRGSLTREIADRERTGASTGVAVTYGVGLGVMAVCGLSLIPLAVVDGFRSPWFILPTAVGGFGLLAIFVAMGMDLAASSWSGFAASIAPTEGGAMATGSGRF